MGWPCMKTPFENLEMLISYSSWTAGLDYQRREREDLERDGVVR